MLFRSITSTHEDHEKFLNNREEIDTVNLEPSVDMYLARSRYSISPEPPPYHIAAAYSKQAAYFNGTTSSPQSSLTSQKPASPVIHHSQISPSEEQRIDSEKKGL